MHDSFSISVLMATVPRKLVVCFTCDGGFWHHLQELEAGVPCGIPTVTCVNNNSFLNQETQIFRQAYNGSPSNKVGEMWRFSKADFTSIAESMGTLGIRVTKPAELRPWTRIGHSTDAPGYPERAGTSINSGCIRRLTSLLAPSNIRDGPTQERLYRPGSRSFITT